MPDSAHDDDLDSESHSKLRAALSSGNPSKVRASIESGADIHYRREHGYGALLDSLHGRDITRDRRLLELLSLLIELGVDLSGVTRCRESGLRVLSRVGRFDAVRLLLDAGANREQLEWTPLMEAVALGDLADVRAKLAEGQNLEERDWWSRTAWLIALLAGSQPKAELLRDSGANTAACGRCDCPPLFYAIEGHHPGLLHWLLDQGVDVHQKDEFGRTALIEAVENDDLECVNMLLDSGADIEVDANGTALSRASSRRVIMRLLEAGADPADANQRIMLGLPAKDHGEGADEALSSITARDFRSGCAARRFGKKNPEQMQVQFWHAMIRAGVSAYGARRRFEKEPRSVDDAVWCAQRFGQSLTLLPDDRAIQIGGEHEDSYDPDFCIYNDVFVYGGDGSIAIYGYPEHVFPPTDFHTATLVGDFIYVIGSLGYAGTRQYGTTPVYRLDIQTLKMEHVPTRGQAPGWIFRHRALAIGKQAIRIWGGTIVTEGPNDESHDCNHDTFVLDLDDFTWQRARA